MFIPVIGAGSIGQRHYANLQALGVKTVLLPWRDLDTVAFRRLGADAAVIATATPVRMDPVRLCTELNIPFYIEKPLAHDAATVEAILDLAGPLAERSMVGFMMRYHPAVHPLANLDLASIYDASFGIGHDVRQWRRNWSFARSYAARPEGGGVLLDLCHELDMALTLLPGCKVADVSSLGHAQFPGVDFASRIALARDRMIGSVAMDYLSPISYRRIVLRGTDCVADFDLIAGRYRIDAGQGAQNVELPFERNDMFLAALRDFLHLVAGRKPETDPGLLPRLDLAADNCRVIADAWSSRRFVGQIEGDYA
jgi:predicted dehydrogenase